jgi:DNA-binding response OmpR family regulator
VSQGGAAHGRPRVLVAEDEFLVAMLLEEDLREAGFSIVGPFTTLEAAREAAENNDFEVAVLDVNMNGEMSFPLADELRRRGVPFIFLSGYGPSVVPEELRSAPRFAKPYETNLLMAEVRRLTS